MHACMQTYNASAAADGTVGGVLPTVVFYLPMFDNGTSRHRYFDVYVPVCTCMLCYVCMYVFLWNIYILGVQIKWEGTVQVPV